MEQSDIIGLLVEAQITAWRCYPFSDLEDRLIHIKNNHFGTFVYTIDCGNVTMHANPGITALIAAGVTHEVYRRATLYLAFLEKVVNSVKLDMRIVFAINVIDLAENSPDLPIFSLQKHAADSNILLPDCELIEHHFMEPYYDTKPFTQKKDKAFFLGSTTGVVNFNLEDIELGRVPRIRAARTFRSSEEVDFHLTSLVQYASHEVRDAVLAEGFGGERAPLLGSYDYKFGISIDGNGAPCSRPAIILNSQSALIKYNSSYVLYYNSAMRDGIEYISVASDADIFGIVRREREQPGLYSEIAEAGSSFARSCISRATAMEYTARLLRDYGNLIAGSR